MSDLRRTFAVLGALVPLLATARLGADPRSDFFCRMLTNTDVRVRISAALRLRDIPTADSVDPLVAALQREPNATARAAILSAIAAVGEPRALPAVEHAAEDPSPAVRTQAAHALAVLRAIAPAPDDNPSLVAPRFRLAIGTFAARDRSDEALAAQALDLLTAGLRTDPSVVLLEPVGIVSRNPLPGYFIDGSVRASTTADGGIRVEISLVVQTDPGREFRFESIASAVVPELPRDASAATRSAARTMAMRHAITSATQHTLTQLSGIR